ncbi:hypothetical protein AB0C02_31465 [Micromonospora sp. NPDC048999]|uniref:hypothetical protein n=1 Tax=Micromonospora sp. NPDC048999 TaxID=3155391 RepID=UPI0033CEBF7D
MSQITPTTGGFTGEPTAALQVTGSGACCGSPAQAVGGILPPAGVGETASGDPCCGARQAADSCCGTQANADAIATGQGCCS